MKTTAYISLIYGLIVILSGVMAFRFDDSLPSLFIEVFLGIFLLGNVFFMMIGKKFSFYVLFIISLLLAVFYGYNFSQSNQFFQGILAAISFFIFIYEFLKIFKVFRS